MKIGLQMKIWCCSSDVPASPARGQDTLIGRPKRLRKALETQGHCDPVARRRPSGVQDALPPRCWTDSARIGWCFKYGGEGVQRQSGLLASAAPRPCPEPN